MNITDLINDTGGLVCYSNSVCRMVDTQAYAATTSLVNNLEEQAILEQILDEFKPSYADDTEDLHYLISAPFRYPPLKYGSFSIARICSSSMIRLSTVVRIPVAIGITRSVRSGNVVAKLMHPSPPVDGPITACNFSIPS